MRKIKLDLEPIPHPSTQKTFKGHKRLGVYDFQSIMSVLAENHVRPPNDGGRAAALLLDNYIVTINGLKLRTFVHHYLKGDCSCSDKECGIKPAYFALEQATTKRNKPRMTAYLSLYGIDKNGQEVEFTHDHTLARCFGGANSLVNTTVMCKKCNNMKSRIEAKMHNKTLMMLKEFLDETSGEESHPQFLLERLRKKEYNNIQHEVLDLERCDVLPLERGIKAILDPHPVLKWGQMRIRTDGLRLKVFAHNHEPHCQNPECQIKATHFAVERVKGKHNDPNMGFYLNMYGRKDDGKEVMFHHHHLLRAGQDGVPDGVDVITLCRECKEKNFDLEVSQYSHTLLNTYKGVSQRDIDDQREQEYEEKLKTLGTAAYTPPAPEKLIKKKQEIQKLVLEVMKKYDITDKDAFLAFCQQEAVKKDFATNVIKGSFMKLIKTELQISNEAARFLAKEHAELFGVAPNAPVHPYEEKINGVPLWESWQQRMCQHYNVDQDALYLMFERQAQLLDKQPKKTPRMRFIMEKTGKDVGFAHAFLRHVGFLFNEGPYNGSNLPKRFAMVQPNGQTAPSYNKVSQGLSEKTALVGHNTVQIMFTPETKLPQSLSNPERQRNLIHMLLKALSHQQALSVSDYWQQSKEYSKQHQFEAHPQFEKIAQRFKNSMEHLGLDPKDGMMFFQQCARIFAWGPLVEPSDIQVVGTVGVFEKAQEILGNTEIPLILGKDRLVLWKEEQPEKTSIQVLPHQNNEPSFSLVSFGRKLTHKITNLFKSPTKH